jgi:hypothetical protein
MTRLSLFNDYNQKENRTTNYCGLMLKLLYEESPIRFENLLNNLIEEDQIFNIGAKFEQQKRRGNITPDMSIVQSSFQILFETQKHFSVFDTPQIIKHLKAFDDNYKTKILFLLSDSVNEIADIEISHDMDIRGEASELGVKIQSISFEQLLEALRIECTSDNLKIYLEEFQDYLAKEKLLPS